METVSVKIIEPKARRILDDLASLKLIELNGAEQQNKPKRRFGAMKGLVVSIADDFDEPLAEFKDYM
jgi:hypothetical protein